MNFKLPKFDKSKLSLPNIKTISLSKSNFRLKSDIVIEKALSLLSGKTLLNELISLNKKVIGVLFAIGFIGSASYSVVSNYDMFQKKIKQQEINEKLFKIWSANNKQTDQKYNTLKNQYNSKVGGVYTLNTIQMEKDLVKLFIAQVNRKSGKYMRLILRIHREDAFSNTTYSEIDVEVKRPIMKVLLVNALMEKGYFVEELSDSKLVMRKIKDKR